MIARRVSGKAVFHVVERRDGALTSLCELSSGPESTWLVTTGDITCRSCVKIRAVKLFDMVRKANEARKTA